MTVPHPFPPSSHNSIRGAGCIQSSFHLFKCIIINVIQGNQRRHLEWKVLMCFMILNPAFRKKKKVFVIVFLIRDFVTSSPRIGKVSTSASNLYLKKNPTLPWSQHLISMHTLAVRGTQETHISLCLTRCSLSNWPGVDGQLGTLQEWKGRWGIRLSCTKYTRQSSNVQNLGWRWCWLMVCVSAMSCWQCGGSLVSPGPPGEVCRSKNLSHSCHYFFP